MYPSNVIRQVETRIASPDFREYMTSSFNVALLLETIYSVRPNQEAARLLRLTITSDPKSLAKRSPEYLLVLRQSIRDNANLVTEQLLGLNYPSEVLMEALDIDIDSGNYDGDIVERDAPFLQQRCRWDWERDSYVLAMRAILAQNGDGYLRYRSLVATTQTELFYCLVLLDDYRILWSISNLRDYPLAVKEYLRWKYVTKQRDNGSSDIINIMSALSRLDPQDAADTADILFKSAQRDLTLIFPEDLKSIQEIQWPMYRRSEERREVVLAELKSILSLGTREVGSWEDVQRITASFPLSAGVAREVYVRALQNRFAYLE